ncbi:hypothetical protein HDU96_001025, partial [Phlyctochytrium bullatum]
SPQQGYGANPAAPQPQPIYAPQPQQPLYQPQPAVQPYPAGGSAYPQHAPVSPSGYPNTTTYGSTVPGPVSASYAPIATSGYPSATGFPPTSTTASYGTSAGAPILGAATSSAPPTYIGGSSTTGSSEADKPQVDVKSSSLFQKAPTPSWAEQQQPPPPVSPTSAPAGGQMMMMLGEKGWNGQVNSAPMAAGGPLPPSRGASVSMAGVAGVAGLSAEELSDKLLAMGVVPEVVGILRGRNLTGAQIFSLSQADLAQMGVYDPMHQQMVMHALGLLKSGGSPAAPPPPQYSF